MLPGNSLLSLHRKHNLNSASMPLIERRKDKVVTVGSIHISVTHQWLGLCGACEVVCQDQKITRGKVNLGFVVSVASGVILPTDPLIMYQ
jgi:MinD superfamily P-loop ATPase